MKKSLTISILLIVSYNMAFSQCELTKAAKHDVLTPGTLPVELKVKKRGKVIVTVTNLNPFLYEASVKDSVITYSREVPDLFTKAFTLPSLPSVPEPAGAPAGGSLAILGNPASTIQQLYDALIELYKTDFKEPVELYLLYSNIPDGIKRILNNCESTGAQIKVQANQYVDQRLAGLKANLSSSTAEIKDEFEKKKNNLKAVGKAIIEACTVLIGQVDAEFAESVKSPATTVVQYKAAEEKRDAKKKPIETLKENTSKILAELEKFDPTPQAADIVNMLNAISDAEFTFRKEVAVPKRADEMIIYLDIKKKSEKGCNSGIGSFQIPVDVCGGIKIDFSTGLIFNIGQKKFFDQKYRYDSVYRANNSLADSIQIKMNSNNNIAIPSVGAFMHIYSRSVKDINLGGALGVSVGSDQRLYYHLGASVFIGREERFIINFGASGAKSKILDGQYKEDQIFKRSLAPASIPTEEAFRIGGYIGFTWNLNIVK